MTESIKTLQEFMVQSKGMAYILAIAYLIGFSWFWKFLHKRERDD
ncbi:MAG TPA: hmc operon protein 4 [Candidatus Cloacimonetes bacterium]|nr:hmc operon protein 4 [Candidatus Cloacimonadota bacterium]